jgi:Flp pilus assembly protein TadG
MKRCIKILCGERGASAVEFAIILPILIMLIFGIIQFGIAYNKYIAVTHAVREGTRLAAVGLYEDPDFDFEQAVRDSAPTIEIENIIVENPEGLGIGRPVRVIVTVETFFIDIPMAGRWGPIQLTSQATMRRER